MPEPIDPKIADKRTAARSIRNGMLDEKAYEKHLKSLPDVAEKAVKVDTAMADAEMDEDEPGEDQSE